MLILEAWLKRRSEYAQEVPVPVDEPEAALPQLQAALAGLREATEADPPDGEALSTRRQSQRAPRASSRGRPRPRAA
jgi:hypothetical protein